jgi:cell shape-determining protein MreC
MMTLIIEFFLLIILIIITALYMIFRMFVDTQTENEIGNDIIEGLKSIAKQLFEFLKLILGFMKEAFDETKRDIFK